MPPPTGALLKAAAAAVPVLSYLDAKYMLRHDLTIIRSYITSQVNQRLYERRGRLSPFYLLEETALSTKPGVAERAFLVYEGTTWSYKQSHDLICRYATWLQERHAVKKGDIVALNFMNKPALIWIWFGLWALGACPAMINYNLAGERLVHCVKISTARLVLVDAEVQAVLDDAATRTALEAAPEDTPDAGPRSIVIVDAATERAVETWRAVRPPDSARAGQKLTDMAMLIYTSGTTGMPKAAIISFQKVHFGAGFSHHYVGLRPTDRFYTCMPLYHSSAAILGVSHTVTAAATLVLGHKFGTKSFWRDVREGQATVIQYVGETCRYLLAAPPQPDDKSHSVRLAFGNGLRPDVWAAFKTRFAVDTVVEFYASTEGSSGSWNYQQGDWGVGAVGRSGGLLRMLMGGGVKIVRVDEETEELVRCPKGWVVECEWMEAGEVIWKLDEKNIEKTFKGYFRNGKATDEKILRNVFRPNDAWFRTGDLQRTSSDGFWYFIDRLGDTFRWKSENVSTTEVSHTLTLHPSILEANVYGVALPHHDGRAGCACVILAPGADEERTLGELGAYVEAQLPGYARPLFVRVAKTMEVTGSHKYVKGGLRKEGVDPELVGGGDTVWWLRGGKYSRFEKRDWEELVGGSVKL